MRSLPELQRDFVAAALFGDETALRALGVASSGLDPAARIAIYRNNVLGNYRKALGATYPMVRRLIGTPFFNAAIDAFVLAYPSRHGDVNRYGVELAGFLATYAPARGLPHLPDVARLEWAIDQANIAADAPAFDLEALARVPDEARGELRFALHPSACLVVSSYPIFRIWQVNQADFRGDDAVDLAAGGDRLLVLRGAESTTIERLGAGEYALLAAFGRGSSLSDAADIAASTEPAFDLAYYLKHHVAAHTIVSFRLRASAKRGNRQ